MHVDKLNTWKTTVWLAHSLLIDLQLVTVDHCVKLRYLENMCGLPILKSDGIQFP